jgi:biotin synthase
MTGMDKTIVRILEAAQEGVPPTQAQCAALLALPELSLEASAVRSVADALIRSRLGDAGIVLGQIGLEIDACPGRCAFCSFGDGHTAFTPSRMSEAEILQNAAAFTNSGELYALFLMTMHIFDFERLLRIIARLRDDIPPSTQIVVNIGDFQRSQAMELKAAGISGAYHVSRLREGTDTALDPAARKATIRAIRESDLDWYYCCEPIGPEHSPEELAAQLFLGIEYGCFQHAAMRRVFLPASPLASRGQISERRLALVVAVVALASMGCPETRSIAVHEPNLLGLTSGANTIYAEAGANPRDTQKETSGHRGHDIDACKRMFYESGFRELLVSPGTRTRLGNVY